MTHNYRDPYDDEAERIHNEVIVVDDDEETLRPDDDAPWYEAEDSEEDEERPFVGEDEENGEEAGHDAMLRLPSCRFSISRSS